MVDYFTKFEYQNQLPVNNNIFQRLAIAALLLLSFQNSFTQCMYYPVSVEQRVSKASYIVLGKVTDKHTYIDKTTGNVNTLNKLTINAWLKNYNDVNEVYVITLGGVYLVNREFKKVKQ